MARKKNNKLYNSNPLIFILIISSIFLIYHILLLGTIESSIRYIIISFILLLDFIFYNNRKKRIPTFILIVLTIIYIILGFTINKFYGLVNSIHKNETIYSTSLIALNETSIDPDNIKDRKIGIINDTLSFDNYVIAKEIINDNNLDKENEIITYSDYFTMLNDLYKNEIDLMFITSNYKTLFQDTEGFENINNCVKVVLEKDKTIKQNNSFNNKSNSSIQSFSILLMGVDSEKDGLKKNAYANGDGLMLVTFNKDTFNVTMMSIPRDSYVAISCRDNVKNKLTHAGWFGTDCMIDTIQNVFDVNIDYYLKINFKGVVNLVDAVGGVTVDVPKKLCTDDSNRSGTICIDGGLQTLNGEEALVLARNRYDLANGDIDRGYNQQLLIKGLINKITQIRSVDTLLKLLEDISNNLDTNLSTDEILSFYNIFKDILLSRNYIDTNDFINISQIKVSGTSKKTYFKSLNSNLWIYDLNKDSVEKASNEMKINLGIKKAEMIKNFSFEP